MMIAVACSVVFYPKIIIMIRYLPHNSTTATVENLVGCNFTELAAPIMSQQITVKLLILAATLFGAFDSGTY